MNCQSIFGLLVILLVLPVLGFGQEPQQTAAPAAFNPAKLAWINLEEAIFTCDEGKRELVEVQKFVDKKNQELKALQQELDNLQNQLLAQAAKLTDEARADLEEQIDAKQTKLQRFQQDTQKEIDGRRVRISNAIARKMVPIIEQFSKEKGLDAVLVLSNSRDIWLNPALIVTADITKAYNQANAAAAKAP